jgi:hypothetical protein
MKGNSIKVELKTNMKNFPYKCFYNDDLDEIYAFYRQGECFIIDAKNLANYNLGKCTEQSLGDMYLVFNKCLVARSSQEIVFFKIVEDEDGKRSWKQHYTLQKKGFLYFIKGNIRIQITTADMVYFYFINPESLEPDLDNVMYNFMNCN